MQIAIKFLSYEKRVFKMQKFDITSKSYKAWNQTIKDGIVFLFK